MSPALLLVALLLVIASVLRWDHFKAIWRAVTRRGRARDREE
jgi:hypothetical protein